MTKFITLGTTDSGQPFTIPLSGAATRAVGIFGKRRSGKSWTAGVWAEQLLEHKVPSVVLDPVGIWAGLGLSADGRGPGYPIAVFGGQQAQVPLTPTMGAAIARYVADQHVPTVVDLSGESKSTWRRVVADFAEELFRINKAPIHIILEEATEFVPQKLFGEMATVYGAVEKLVRMGRNRAVGITLIGQRLQAVNKDALSQVDALFVMRLLDPQGKKAAREWVQSKGEEEQADAFVEALASLETGTAYFWSPEWLERFEQVKIGMRRTFHYDPDRATEEGEPLGPIARAVDSDELQRTFAQFMNGEQRSVAKGKAVDGQAARR